MPHYLISCFTNCDSISISWITWLIFACKSFVKDGCPIILIDMEPSNATSFSNSSINTPAANVITRVSRYTFTHVSIVNYLLNARFFTNCYTIAKVFLRMTRRSCNHETFAPRTICIIWYLGIY